MAAKKRSAFSRMPFHFTSSETHKTFVDGKETTKEQIVNVKNGKGTKTLIVHDNKGTKKSTKKLTKEQIKNIQKRKFMPNLFSDCQNCLRPVSSSSKTRKIRRGTR